MTEKEQVLRDTPPQHIWIGGECKTGLRDDAVDYANGAFFKKSNGELCAYIFAGGDTLIIPQEVCRIPSGFDFRNPGLKKLVFRGDLVDSMCSFHRSPLEEIVYEGECRGFLFFLFEGMFDYSDQLRSVTLPRGITDISKWAFHNCSALTHVEIPESVTKIRDLAFCDCESLTELVIPEGVQEIRHRAFDGCKSLKRISLPRSLKHLYGGVFDGCDSLETIVFRGTVAQWDLVKKGHQQTTSTNHYDNSRVGYDWSEESTYYCDWKPQHKYKMKFEP